MKKKMIIAIGGSIVLVSIAATYFALNSSNEGYTYKRQWPKPIIERRPIPEAFEEPLDAYPIYKRLNEHFYIDNELNPPSKLWVVGDSGVVEVNHYDQISVNYKICLKKYGRVLERYEPKTETQMKPYVAFTRSDIKFEAINGGFEEFDIPDELISWIKLNLNQIAESRDVLGDNFDPLKNCIYKANTNKVEMIECGESEILLYNRNPIISLKNPSYHPLAYLVIGDKKYLMSTYHEDGIDKVSLLSDQVSKYIKVKETTYKHECDEDGEDNSWEEEP